MSSFDREPQSAAQSQDKKKTGQTPPPPKKSGLSPLIVALGGGVVAVAVVAGVLMHGGEAAGTADRPTLSLVKQGDIDQAAGTLSPDAKTKIVEDAKACKMPLAIVQLTKADADGGGVVRVHAGSYVSPPFTVGDAPVNVAVPFPAPYEAGKGEISFEGTAKGVFAQLTPGIKLDTAGGAQTIPVWWKTDKPCGA